MSNIYYGMKEKRVTIHEIENPFLLGNIRLTLTGSHSALIENYKGIVEYQPNSIILQSQKEMVTLRGGNLHILYYTKDEMKIKGNIELIEVKEMDL